MKRLAAVMVLLAVPLAPASRASEPLGRLFYTPAQRVQLDAARSQKGRAEVATEPEKAAPLPETVTYGGVVRRSDGRTTVWINNHAIDDGRATGGLAVASRVHPDGSVNLGVSQSERSVRLKVGQSVDLASGTIGEPYSRARASQKPPAPPAPAAKPAATTAPADARPAVAPRKDADDDGPDAR